MSALATVQGIEPFIAPDSFTLPAVVPAVRLHPEDRIEMRENCFLLKRVNPSKLPKGVNPSKLPKDYYSVIEQKCANHFKLIAPWPSSVREPDIGLIALSPENKQWQPLWQPRPFRRTRTGAEAAESTTFRSERIDACLDHTNSDVRTLADFDPSIYSKWLRKQYTNATASTGARVAASGCRSKLFRVVDEVGLIERELPTTPSYHDLTMKQAETDERSVLPVRKIEEGTAEYNQIFGQHQVNYGSHTHWHAYPKVTKPKPVNVSLEREATRLIKEKCGEEEEIVAEIVFISMNGSPEKVDVAHNADGEKIHASNPLEGACITNENATENNFPLDHTDLEARRKLAKIKPFPIEIFTRNTPIAEVAEREGVSEKTMQKRVERFEAEAEMMEKGYPEAKDPLTDEQWDDIMEKGAVYILVKTNEWTWYKLDLETYGSVGCATAALREEQETRALKRNKEWRSGTRAQQKMAAIEVINRYDEVFNPSNIFIMQKPAWMGVLSEVSSPIQQLIDALRELPDDK